HAARPASCRRAARHSRHAAPCRGRPAAAAGAGRSVARPSWLSVRPEAHGMSVHAVTKPGRLRPVREDVTEMCVDAGAAYLDPAHAMAAILDPAPHARLDRLEKARPAAAGIELGIGAE